MRAADVADLLEAHLKRCEEHRVQDEKSQWCGQNAYALAYGYLKEAIVQTIADVRSKQQPAAKDYAAARRHVEQWIGEEEYEGSHARLIRHLRVLLA